MLNFLFGFSGRIRRRSYLLGVLGAQIGVTAIAVAIIEASRPEFFVIDPRRPGEDVLSPFVSQVFAGVVVVLAWILTALFFKRMHDFSATNRQKFRYLKWLYFVAVIPCLLLNLLSLLALGQMFQGMLSTVASGVLLIPAFPGPEDGPNEFGPDPRKSPDAPVDRDVGNLAAVTPPNSLRMREMARSGSSSGFGARPIGGKVAFGRR
jgi:uncharacterized membrane protein YhaH (DUF805 family)